MTTYPSQFWEISRGKMKPNPRNVHEIVPRKTEDTRKGHTREPNTCVTRKPGTSERYAFKFGQGNLLIYFFFRDIDDINFLHVDLIFFVCGGGV